MENRLQGQRLDRSRKKAQLTAQVRGQGRSCQVNRHEGGKNRLFSGSILKIQLTIFTGIRCAV